MIFVVREPFLSKYTQVGISAGTIGTGFSLEIESFMPDNGVIFSDGIEADYLRFNSGAIVKIGIADQRARLVLGTMKK